MNTQHEQDTCFPAHLDEETPPEREPEGRPERNVVVLTASLAVPRLRIAGEGKRVRSARPCFSLDPNVSGYTGVCALREANSFFHRTPIELAAGTIGCEKPRNSGTPGGT